MDGGGRGGAAAVPALSPVPDPVPLAGRAGRSGAAAAAAASAAPVDGGGGGGGGGGASADDDGPVSEVLRVHKAIRMELNLVLQRVDLLPCVDGSATSANPREVTALAERVSFLRRMVQEHSKAEDNVVLPKLEERVHGLVEKYSNEHVVERGLFEKLSALFVRLECLPSAVESERLVQSIQEVTRALRDSMFSHLAEEEAQLWPLLVTHFTKDEAAEIVARIFGTMPAEHLQEMLPWMVRVLSASEQAEMMSHIFQVTRSTMFETWLKSWFPMPKVIVASPVSTGGVAAEEARGASAGGGGGGGDGGGGGSGSGGGGGGSSGGGAAAPSASAGGNSAGRSQSANGATAAVMPTERSPTHHPPSTSAAYRTGASPGASASSPRPTTAILNDTETASAAAALVLLKGKVNMEAAIREIGRDTSLPVEARGRMIHQLLLAPWVQTTAATARSKDAARDAADRRYRDGGAGASGCASGGLAETSGAGDAGGAGGAAGAGGVLGAGASGTGLVPSTGAWPVTRGLVRQEAAAGASADGVDGPPAAGKVVPGYVRAPTQRELEPVFRTLPDGQRVRGCSHYLRAAKLRAKCCDRIYPCRLCHDAECGHTMDRPATEEMLCTYCGTVQPVAGKCAVETCGRLLARYYCSVCKYFDDDTSRSIYHCHSCNVCRVGRGLGIDFFHCMKCNACMNMKYAREHRCVERALESDCPVCHQFLFTSTSPVKYLRCGHLMHVSCYRQYARRSYSCPICAKSLADMTSYFERLDYLLAGEQMPVEYRSARADVWCNDCSRPSVVPYHFLYNRCGFCCSYNTRVNSVDPNGGRDRGLLPERLPPGAVARLPAVRARLVAPPQRGALAASPPSAASAAAAAAAAAAHADAAAAAAAAAAGRWHASAPPPLVAAAATAPGGGGGGRGHAREPLAAAASPVASPSVSPSLSATSVPPAAVVQMAAVTSSTASASVVAGGGRTPTGGRVAPLTGRKRPRR